MFFIPFLMHREHRDEQRMKKKYGPTYEEYRKVAKYRIFPFIY
jgi:protein-S-isoprenylcysteine O-methyltransferase Ste14